MIKNVPVNVPVYVSYDGDLNDFLPECERSSFVSVPNDIKESDWNHREVKYHTMTDDNLLVGFSDGEFFHILNKTNKFCNLPLAIAKEEYKFATDDDKRYNGTLRDFVKVYNSIKGSGARFTIDWREDDRELDKKTFESFDQHRKNANLPTWAAGDYKLFPIFVWEVTNIPLKNVTFVKNAIASEERDIPYYDYIFELINNKIN